MSVGWVLGLVIRLVVRVRLRVRVGFWTGCKTRKVRDWVGGL